MAKPRIPTKPAEIRDMLLKASLAIQNTVNWPVTAPTSNALQATYGQMNTIIGLIDGHREQVGILLAQLATQADTGTDLLKQVDFTTDGMFGPQSPEKVRFGLEPKKSTAGSSVPLEQVVITKIGKGKSSKSLFLDWDNEEGAGAYQVEVYLDSALTQIIHSASVTESEYSIKGLVQGTQYWVRVCAIRGSEQGPWSDVATEVAGI